MKKLLSAALFTLIAASPAAAADVAGNWTIAATIAEMEVPLTCTFKQDGEKLTGNCQGPGAPPEGLPITGESKGSNLTWTYSIAVQGMDLTITYTGTVDTPATIKGDVSVSGGQAAGSFTGKKAQ